MSGKKYLFKIIPAICFLAATPAHAGFEWTPPAASAPAAKTTPLPAMPMPPVEREIRQEVLTGAEPVAPALREPSRSLTDEVLNKKEQKMPAQQDRNMFDDEPLAGFGNDIPLILAMRQIVPPSYAFSFDKGVDQSMRVNWNGGRPWHVVLEDMLFGAGLGLVISENRVWVRDEAYLAGEDRKEAPEEKMPALEAYAAKEQKTSAPAPAEPLDIIMKKQQPPAEKTGMVYRRPASLQAQESPKNLSPSYDEEIDYQSVSEKHEKAYNPSYPRRTPAIDKIAPADDSEQQALSAEEPAPRYQDMSLPSTHTAPASEEKPFSSDLKEKDVAAKMPVAPDFPKMKNAASSQGQVIGQDTSVDPYDIYFWQANKGDSLRETLATWAQQAGAEMFWGAPYDYHLPTSINMHGSFPDAVKSALMIYETMENRPVGRLHPNLPDGPAVLVIENVSSAQASF